MTYTVSITSQGQISIPAKLRRELQLHKTKKAVISKQDGKLIIQPIRDLLDLKGALHHKAIKNKSIDQVMKEEEKAIADGFVERYRKQMEKMNTISSKK